MVSCRINSVSYAARSSTGMAFVLRWRYKYKFLPKIKLQRRKKTQENNETDFTDMFLEFHFTLNGSKDMVWWKMYHFLGHPVLTVACRRRRPSECHANYKEWNGGRSCPQNWLPRQRFLGDRKKTSDRSSTPKVLPTVQISWRSVP